MAIDNSVCLGEGPDGLKFLADQMRKLVAQSRTLRFVLPVPPRQWQSVRSRGNAGPDRLDEFHALLDGQGEDFRDELWLPHAF